MTDFYLSVKENPSILEGIYLVGGDLRTAEKVLKLPRDKIHRFKLIKERNPDHHRKYWAMLATVLENCETEYTNTDQLHHVLKLKIGHYDLMVGIDGQPVYMTKSTDFGNMDQTEFEEYYEKCVKVIFAYWVNYDNREQLDELMNF